MRVVRYLAVACVLGLAVGAPSHAQTPVRGGTLTIGAQSPRHLNPAIQAGQATGVPGTQLFAGLVELDDKFQPHPYLAKSWTVSEDGRTYTFRLVEGAVFHDGKPITSGDVAFSLKVVKENHPFGPAMFGSVERVETPDAQTVVIRLSKPHPALLTAMSPLLLPIIPEHVYGTQAIQSHPANSAPVGSGPFRFVELKQGEHLILERNDKYFRPGLPYLDRIVFRFIKDPTTATLGIERGEIDYLPFAPVRVRDIARLEGNSKVKVTRRGYEALGPTNYLEFNHRVAPLDDKRVRQAIAYSIDRDFIVKSLQVGLSKRLDGPFHHSSPFFDDSALKKYPLDLERANALLDEAGHKRGADGMRFSLTLDWLPDVHPDSQGTVAQYLRTQFKKVGIDIQLRQSPDFPTWARRVSNWEHQLSMNAIWIYPDPVIGMHRAFLCSNQKKGVIWSNTEGYCNERVDALLQQAASETNLQKRKALYSEVQKILSEDLPFTWTNEEPLHTLYSARIGNVPQSVWGPLQPMDKVYKSAN